MKVLITGATGFIGRNLCNHLAGKHRVTALTRRQEKAAALLTGAVDIAEWDPGKPANLEKCLDNSDAVVNLAGAGVVEKRWTKARKAEIFGSRLSASGALIDAIKKAETKPEVFIQASAIGFYGSRGDEQLNEASAAGDGFLAEVCGATEDSTAEIDRLDIRSVIIRTGVVLDESGGALPKMITPFKLYLGGYWSSGNQWISWISLADEIAAIEFLIQNNNLRGVFNLTSPRPLVNREFFRTLAAYLKKPCWLPLPGPILKLVFGEMADEFFLTSQRVYPGKLLDAGYQFKYPDLKNALAGHRRDSGETVT